MTTIDASSIRPKLYMGSRPPTGNHLRNHGFDVLVLCARELPFTSADFPGVEVLRCPLDDDASMPVPLPEWQKIVRVAERVARRVRSGRRVLVTCAAGLNRSGIVTAAVVHFTTGVSGSRAAQYIQRRRVVGGQRALYNPAFVQALTRLPEREWMLR